MTKEKNRELYGIVWKRFDVVLHPGLLLITKEFYFSIDRKTRQYSLMKNNGDVDHSYNAFDMNYWVPLYDKGELIRCVIGGYDYIKEKYGKSTEEGSMPEVPKQW